MNDNGVCRIAPATPSLLKTKFRMSVGSFTKSQIQMKTQFRQDLDSDEILALLIFFLLSLAAWPLNDGLIFQITQTIYFH